MPNYPHYSSDHVIDVKQIVGHLIPRPTFGDTCTIMSTCFFVFYFIFFCVICRCETHNCACLKHHTNYSKQISVMCLSQGHIDLIPIIRSLARRSNQLSYAAAKSNGETRKCQVIFKVLLFE